MEDGIDRWQLAGAYVGSVLGAGFASGNEHMRFFVVFGALGYYGIVLAGVFFMILGGLFLRFAVAHKTRSHDELLHRLGAPPVAVLFDFLMSVFLLISLSVMLAGGGALGARFDGPWAGMLLMASATFAVVGLHVERMLRVNGLIALVLAVFVLLIGAFALVQSGGEAPAPARLEYAGWVPGHWAISGFLYAAYNLTLGFGLFGALGAWIRSEREAWLGGVLGGAVLAAMSFSVSIAVGSAMPEAAEREIPLLAALEGMPSPVRAGYVAAVWLAMLTTAVTSCYTLARRLSQVVQFPWTVLVLVVLGVALPASTLGFGALVATMYPLVGYVGAGCLLLAAFRPKPAAR